jgi:protein-disulfide isomerase
MRMTRRELGAIATGFIITLAAIGFRRDVLGLVLSAAADEPSNGDLMVAGPLGEKAQGKADAPVTIIEYASMTCPHCAHFAVNVYPVLKSRYIDTGQVRYILREFPLDPLATAGFMLARCAGDDKYFTVVDLLFRKQQDWVVQRPLAPLLGIAEQEGFSKESFDACLANQQVLDGIEWVRQRAATRFGVDSTPTFFINGEIHRGDMTLAELEQALRSAPKNALKSTPKTGG